MNLFHKTYLSFVKQNISNFDSSEAAPKKSSLFQDMALYPVKSNTYQFYVTNGQSQVLPS